MSPRWLRWGLNLWPPFIGAGIRVRSIAADWGEAVVEMRLGRLNRNYVGTHFGGSLFAMTDPFFVLLLMHRLGQRHIVWDKAGRIDYVEPGRGTVRAIFRMPAERVAEIEALAAGGAKVLPEFEVDVVHPEDGSVVARVHKTLYVRLKPRFRPAAAAEGDDA